MTNTNMSTQQEIQELLADFFCGISLSDWSMFEKYYQQRFNKSLDYQSLGVTDFTQLVNKMGKKVVVFKKRESEEQYVMSAAVAESRRKMGLKPNVKKLLYKHGGKIEFVSFEDCYKDQFKRNLFYGVYGLTDLDQLCQIFDNNILVVEEEKSSGKKVIKAVKGMHNKRARKK